MEKRAVTDPPGKARQDTAQSAAATEPAAPLASVLKVNQLCSLAETLNKLGQKLPALKTLGQAKKLLPDHYLPFLIQGIMHYDKKEYNEALAQLRQAKTLNPFHEETCNYLSLACYHSGHFEDALFAMIDAFLLSGEFKSDTPSTYQQRIKIILDNIEDMSPSKRKQIFKERQHLFEELYANTAKEMGEAELPPLPQSQDKPAKAKPAPAPPAPTPEGDRIDLPLLRAQPLLASLSDEQLGSLSAVTQQMQVAKDGYLFREENPAKGIFLCLSGKVLLQKSTPFGSLAYREINKGGFLGEEQLLEGETHWADAACPEGAEALLLPKAELQELFLRDRSLAVHFLWYFWKNIGRSLLLCYLQLLPELEQEESQMREKDWLRGSFDMQKDLSGKLLGLEQKNLSRNEIRMLEAISAPREVHTGGVLYKENDYSPGLHVVCAGSVILSRGEGEAAAILEAGECCGELSLIGEMPMRETARSFSDGTRILLIDRELCSKVVNGDQEQAYLFLSLLCRLLSKRLLLLTEKIFQTRMILNSQRLKGA